MYSFQILAFEDNRIVGKYGYIIRVLAPATQILDVDFIYMKDVYGELHSVVEDAVDIKTLNDYLIDIDCPDYAFSKDANGCYVFVKSNGLYNSENTDLDDWVVSHSYELGDIVKVETSKGTAVLECMQIGSSLFEAPDWDTLIEDTDMGKYFSETVPNVEPIGHETADLLWRILRYADYTDIFPFVASVYLYIFGKKEPTEITSSASLIDVDMKNIGIFLDYCVREACHLKGMPVPKAVMQNIRNFEVKYANS